MSGTARHAGFRGARGVRRDALALWVQGLRINFRYFLLGKPKSIGRRVHHVRSRANRHWGMPATV